MTGLDDDEEYGPEDFRPAPHPDDRLWRHPSEIAAMHAASQRAVEAEPAADDDTVELNVAAVDVPETATQPRRVHTGLLAAAVVVIVGASAIAMGALSTRSDQSISSGLLVDDVAVAEPATAPPPPAATGDRAVAAANSAEQELAERIHDDLAHSLPRIQAATASGMRDGSGLFVSEEGHLITSAALVHEADYVLAWTEDGRRWPATLIASDPISDVAVLAIDGPTSSAAFSTESRLRTGQYAMAIDHANRTMSLGEVESLLSINYGQTSADVVAAADPSSRVLVAPNTLPGSAIIDDTGAIIAMANISTDSTVTATPAWMLDRVVDELMHNGQASHAWLGILVEPAGDASSVVVTAVVDDSPCDHAKLKSGDIIDAVDGEPLSTTMSLWAMVQRRSPGDTVDLAVTRNGQRRLVQVTLGDSSWARD